MDGVVVHQHQVAFGEQRLDLVQTIPVDGARWIAVRARGGKARYSGDNYTFAHTTPVYFTDAVPNAASRASADFLAAMIEELWSTVSSRDAFAGPAARERYRAHLDEARTASSRRGEPRIRLPSFRGPSLVCLTSIHLVPRPHGHE